ncbi:MAG: GMC family oxidoreductase N-terminal domain-containing protein [Pseudomonadota bacterium]
MGTFDYVIVGAGSAGCILANRLSEDPRVSVCVLEAGGYDWNPFVHIPAGFIKTFYDASVNWKYEMEEGAWTGGRRIFAPRGKTLGGSSSINGHVYNRGQRFDFDTWAQFGNSGWGYADVLPYFQRTERRVGQGDDTYRGRDGRVAVTDLEWRDPLCDAFIEGCVQHGIPRNLDYNGEKQEGVSYVQRTINNGRRVSTAGAYLRPAMNRSNLHVITKAHATGIVVENGRAVGIRFRHGGARGQDKNVTARQEVVLSGGAYNSPQLLQLSGIGPADVLRAQGIDVRHELQGVGENLRDHYAPRLVARVKNAATINEKSRGLSLAWEVAKWVTRRQGILTLNPTLVYCFWHSGEAAESSDIQMTFTPASYNEGVQGELERRPGMTVAAWQQRPESKGYVRIRSESPFDQPTIQPNYLAEEHDRRVLLAGLKLARKLLASDPLKPYYDSEAIPGPNVQTDDELLAVAQQYGTTTFHPMGTCKMGPASDPLAVVDDQLRVHGIDALRVIDASIMPTMLSANLNAATMMIGEKGADLVRGREPLPSASVS